MNDDTTQWVLPALSLGYSVAQDDAGRLRFWQEHVEIVFRDSYWFALDGIDPARQYSSLRVALEEET